MRTSPTLLRGSDGVYLGRELAVRVGQREVQHLRRPHLPGAGAQKVISGELDFLLLLPTLLNLGLDMLKGKFTYLLHSLCRQAAWPSPDKVTIRSWTCPSCTARSCRIHRFCHPLRFLSFWLGWRFD